MLLVKSPTHVTIENWDSPGYTVWLSNQVYPVTTFTEAVPPLRTQLNVRVASHVLSDYIY